MKEAEFGKEPESVKETESKEPESVKADDGDSTTFERQASGHKNRQGPSRRYVRCFSLDSTLSVIILQRVT